MLTDCMENEIEYWREKAENAIIKCYFQYLDSDYKEQGQRAKVVGGKNLDPLADLLKEITVKYAPQGVVLELNPSLPGFYRDSKNWDFSVRFDEFLIATIELKSQGSSIGKNFNNRVEEALGSITDLKAAEKYDSLKFKTRPFYGYLTVLNNENYQLTKSSKKYYKGVWPIRPEFKNKNYLEKYQLLCKKMEAENLYTSAGIIEIDDQGNIILNLENGFNQFLASYISHLMKCCLYYN